MKKTRERALQGALAAALAAPAGAAAQGWAFNVYGASYHVDRAAARERQFEEFNPGLALRYEWPNRAFAEAGAYRDSGGATARFATLGYQWRRGSLRAGGGLAVLSSPTYNDGRTFAAPLPVLSYDFGPVMLNAVYFPRVTRYSALETFGFYLTVPLGRAGQSAAKLGPA